MPPLLLDADPIRQWAQVYNYAEVLIWPVMGLVLLAAAVRRRGAVRRDFVLAGLTLLVFGSTDYFEAENGNQWWTPWWLFLWKAACVAALLAVLIVAYRRERAAKRAVKAAKLSTLEGEGAKQAETASGPHYPVPRGEG